MTEDTRTIPPYNRDPFAPPAETTQQPLPGFGAGHPDLPPPQSPGSPDRRPRRGVTTLVAVALAAGLLGGGVGAAVTSQLDSNQGSTTVSSLDQPATGTASDTKATAVEQVASRLLPSVVSIEERTATGGGEGTGVILSSDGLVLTNNHVVAGAAEGGTLSVTMNDGSTSPATIVGRDPVTDLAVIRIKGASGLKPAVLGQSSNLRPGEPVVAIGSPLGLQGTVTSGIVSALDRPVRTGSATAAGDTSTVIDAIQTDAAINPGNSGGPLVNLSGQVVGINSAIASLGSTGGQSGSIGLGFAIPIDQARNIAQQLIKSGTATHAQLGVSVRDAAGGDQTSVGAFIAAVTPTGAANAAGLQAGDVVTKVGDRRIDGADSLIAAIRTDRPGDKVILTVERGGSTRQVTVTLGSDAPQT